MAGLYGSAHSSPDDELGRQLLCQLSEAETGRGRVMHETNAISAVSVHKQGCCHLGRALVGLGSGGKFEGDVIVITATP